MTDFYSSEPAEWAVSRSLVGYATAVDAMEARVDRIARGEAAELIWLLEHPPLYTAGTSAPPDHLLAPHRLPVYRTGRGGQFTYHGPGQRVVYVMLDLNRRHRDVRAFVGALERWVIGALRRLDVNAQSRPGRIGVWVARPEKGEGTEEKIAAVGIRMRRWVTFHGLSLNVAPELDHFSGIVPCGLAGYRMTSLADLGRHVPLAAADTALEAQFIAEFGPVTRVAAPQSDRHRIARGAIGP